MKDLFISHASNDKDQIVRLLVTELTSHNISCWVDEAEIHWGESITNKINQGLSSSKFVLVIISEAFLSKNWTKKELESAFHIEATDGKLKVLPLIVGGESIERKFVSMYPLLRDKLFVRWDIGPSEIVNKLISLLGASDGEKSESAHPRIEHRNTSYNSSVFSTRWVGLAGGGIAGVACGLAYYLLLDRSSIEVVLYTIAFLSLVGFMLGLFYETAVDSTVYETSFLRASFVVKSALFSAFAVSPVGAFASKLVTDECFAGVQRGIDPRLVCRAPAGESLLVFGSLILAIAISIGTLSYHCKARRVSILKPITSASMIAVYFAMGEFVILYYLDIFHSHFDIRLYPAVNPKTVLIGGGILGAATGLLIGLHAALMVLFVPEKSVHK